jgi:phospho-N-acetylmuramoyl-pentapeptide-transferase
MGNVGSHILGAILALIPILIHREILIFVVYLVFLVDGLSSPIQSIFYKLTKKRLFLMAPIHHHFELLGWPETKVTLRFWIIGIICSLLGILIAIL